MEYTLINLMFLIPASVLLWWAVRNQRAAQKGALTSGTELSWRALAATAAGLVALTVGFDNLMIAVGLFYYDESRTSGIFLGLMPVEDLAYVVFAFLALPAAWELLGKDR